MLYVFPTAFLLSIASLKASATFSTQVISTMFLPSLNSGMPIFLFALISLGIMLVSPIPNNPLGRIITFSNLSSSMLFIKFST